LLDIIVERIFGALSERPQRGGLLHHYPHTHDHDAEESEEQTKDAQALHAQFASREGVGTAGCP
jgi:hypothetical protein